jgi:hypothetical protein
MEEALGMDVFDSGDGLVGDKEDGFERKSSAAVVEEILKRRAENVVNQRVEVALLPEPPHARDSHPAGQRLVCLLLASERLGVISHIRELYGDFLARLEVGPYLGQRRPEQREAARDNAPV